MIRKTIIVILILICFTSNANANGLIVKNNIEAPEIYIQLYPADGYLHIKEYKISSLLDDPEKIKKQIDEIAESVKSATYCHRRFGFKQFIPIEERMFINQDIVTGEYHLLTKEKDLKKIMQDCFGVLLNRKVAVTIEDKAIGLHYEGDDIVVADNNALGVYGKGAMRVIFWKNGDRYYEAVFRPKKEVETSKSIIEYFEADVESPKKSKAEIEAWKSGK